MAKTVKTVSPQLKIEVKSTIFGIDSDLERRNMLVLSHKVRPIYNSDLVTTHSVVRSNHTQCSQK